MNTDKQTVQRRNPAHYQPTAAISHGGKGYHSRLSIWSITCAIRVTTDPVLCDQGLKLDSASKHSKHKISQTATHLALYR